MKLVKQDLRNIDRWLAKNDIKYVDIRYELMDHLISEYENLENYPDLESFLIERLAWCKEVAKKKQIALQRSYFKEVWKQLLGLFSTKKTLFILIIICSIYGIIYPLLTSKQFKWALATPFLVVFLYQAYLLFFKSFNAKKQKEYISISALIGVFSLPQLFLYCFNMFPNEWLNNLYFLIPYISFGTLINIAAILAFYEKRKVVVKEYEFLKVYLA